MTSRIRAALCASVAAVAACSSEPARNQMTQFAPAGDAGDAHPGALRTFGDWAVGCDNTALCTMASLGVGAAFPDLTMAVLRQPGPGGAYDVSFETAQDGDPVTPVAATIDGTRIALPTLNGAPAAALARAMAEGRNLALIAGSGRARARLSLAGAAAALRWIDAQQGRVGTVTAAVARGPRPATAVPRPRDAPVIHAVRSNAAAAAPTAAQLAAMRARAGCGNDAAAAAPPRTYRLDEAATLVLVACSSGAYNVASVPFVLRGDTVAPARLDAPSGFTGAQRAGRPVGAVNGEWRDGVLKGFAKGRGLGDCGVRQDFVWDGERLRLSDQAEMGECRGNPNFITTWRTQVVRR